MLFFINNIFKKIHRFHYLYVQFEIACPLFPKNSRRVFHIYLFSLVCCQFHKSVLRLSSGERPRAPGAIVPSADGAAWGPTGSPKSSSAKAAWKWSVTLPTAWKMLVRQENNQIAKHRPQKNILDPKYSCNLFYSNSDSNDPHAFPLRLIICILNTRLSILVSAAARPVRWLNGGDGKLKTHKPPESKQRRTNKEFEISSNVIYYTWIPLTWNIPSTTKQTTAVTGGTSSLARLFSPFLPWPSASRCCGGVIVTQGVPQTPWPQRGLSWK